MTIGRLRLLPLPAALLLAAAGVLGWLWAAAGAPAERPGREVAVEIPPHSTLVAAAERLGRAGVVRSPRFLVFLGKLTGRAGQVQAGELAFHTGMSPMQALETLAHGRAVLHQVTFPEGFTVRQMGQALASRGLADAERFAALAGSASFARSLGIPAPTLEGFLYPDTYAWPRGLSEEEIIRRMRGRFDEVFDEGMRSRARAAGLTVLQAVTLASVIERETGAPSERRLVAGVFANRLRRGYRLQSDPTVIYGIPAFTGNLTREDLARDTPWNTYTRAGLPAGPIANPGRESLEAALAPAETRYIYFVARGDGTHVFAETLVEQRLDLPAPRTPLRGEGAVNIDPQLARDALGALLSGGGEFADFFYEDTAFSTLQAENGRMEKVSSGRERGAGLRLVKRGVTSFGSTVDVSPDGILSLARDLAAGGGGGKTGGGRASSSPSAEGDDQLRLLPLEGKASLALAGVEAARGFDRRVTSARTVVRDSLSRVLVANSRGTLARGERSQAVFFVHAVAAEGERRETGYEPAGGPDASAALAALDPAAVARAACRRALMALDAAEAPSGVMTVVLSSEAGGTMIHEAVGHGLEADLVEKGVSVYRGRMGERVASPLISVVDDPTLAGRRGSYAFDDEGTAAERTILVEEGVLVAYLNDLLTAGRLDLAPNGHGRRQSFRCWPIPRMGNTLILPGKDDPGEIVGSVARGLLVRRMGGGQVNPANGDFVFEVSEGYLIEKGKVAGPVRGATLAGNGPEVLSRVDMVGADLGFGIGTCGKEGQGVPVSDAQPTLRIPAIAVGGRESAGGS